MKTLNKKSVLFVLLTFVLLLSLAFVFVPSNNVQASNSETLYVKGAQAYSGDDADTSAIRFVAGVNKTWYNETLLPANQDKTITFGLLIAPDKGAELTTATAKVKNFTYNYIKENTKDGDLEYMGDITYLLNDDFWADLANKEGVESLTDSEKAKYRLKAHSMDLVARPYYKIDGGEPVYGEQIEYARSIRNVVNQTVIDGEDISKEAVEKYLGKVEVEKDGIFFDDKTKEIFGYKATDDMTYSVGGKSIPATVTDNVATLASLTAEVKPGVDFVISAFDSQNNVTRITAKHASVVLRDADNITWLFGAENADNHLTGYYVLGNDIDASTADVDGSIRFATAKGYFRGDFDGRGYVISNLNISGTSTTVGSLFGKLDGATIKNVAFTNVLANYAAVVSSNANYNIKGYPIINNVYVSVNPKTATFKGIVNQGSIKISNTFVEYLNNVTESGVGTFSGHILTNNIADKTNYVVSRTPETNYVKGDSAVTDYDYVTRYDDLSKMKEDSTQSFSTIFNNSCWKIVDGIPVWHSLNAKDDTFRALSIQDDTIPLNLDLSGLDFNMSDVTAIEIEGQKVDVDGSLPAMEMVVYGSRDKFRLSVDGMDPIYIEKIAAEKDFIPVTFTMYFDEDKEPFDLSNVHVYSMFLKDAADVKWLFGSANSKNNLDGYYVLANDIYDADVSGGHRFSTTATNKYQNNVQASQFVGVFDGMGHTLFNLNVSGNSSRGWVGSLFGQTNNAKPSESGVKMAFATIRNVAFENVKANLASIVTNLGGSYNGENVEVSNVYVSVSKDTTDFRGLIRKATGIVIKNCIIDFPGEQSERGSFYEQNSAPGNNSLNNYVISKTELVLIKNSEEVYEPKVLDGSIVKRYNTLKDFTDAVANALATEDKTDDFDFSSFNYCWTISTDGIPVWKALSSN
jgi:hypothetical protein